MFAHYFQLYDQQQHYEGQMSALRDQVNKLQTANAQILSRAKNNNDRSASNDFSVPSHGLFCGGLFFAVTYRFLSLNANQLSGICE